MVRPTKGGRNKRLGQNKTLVKPWTQSCITGEREREREMFGRGTVWSVLRRGKEACGGFHKLRGTPFSYSSSSTPFKFLSPPVSTHCFHAFRSQLIPKVTSLSHLGTLQFSIFIPFKLVWSYGVMIRSFTFYIFTIIPCHSLVLFESLPVPDDAIMWVWMIS